MPAPLCACFAGILTAMDSYFNTTVMKSSASARRAAAGAAARQGHAPGGANGYRLSSDELNSGLEVRMVSITTLPVEVVSELIRLHRTWADGSVEIDPRILN
jgi:hypothetical protein